MTSSFNLFSGFGGGYINPESLRGANSVTSLGSGATFAAEQFMGISANAAGEGFLNGLLRTALGGYGFLVDTVTGQRVIFQYNVQAKETGGAEYAAQPCLGRSVPRRVYKGGKDRMLDVPITFTMKEFTREDVKRQMRFLQSLAYPDYNGDDVSLAPHPVVLIQGKMYSQDVWLVQDYSIEPGDARDPITQLPSEVTVNLTLVETALRAKSSGDVLRL